MRNSLGKVEQLDAVIAQKLSQRGISLKKGVSSTRTIPWTGTGTVPRLCEDSHEDSTLAAGQKCTPPTAESHYHTTYRTHYRRISESKDEIFADKSEPLGGSTGSYRTDHTKIKIGCCKPLRAIQIPKVDCIGKLTRRARPLSGLVANATSKKRWRNRNWVFVRAR